MAVEKRTKQGYLVHLLASSPNMLAKSFPEEELASYGVVKERTNESLVKLTTRLHTQASAMATLMLQVQALEKFILAESDGNSK